MSMCRENLQHTQEFQKHYHDKHTKPKSYVPGDKVWLNSKYIKTKRNCKLEFKFFKPFWILHLVGKQGYKLELPKRWRIHDVFNVSLLEQDTTRKRRVDKKTSQLEFEDDSEGEEYKVEAICDSTVYAKESESGQLPGLYYLISWKDFPEEENTWEPASAIQHLRRLVSTFHKENPDKPTATSTPVDTAPPTARPTVKPGARNNKRKRGRPAKASSTSKRSKKNWALVSPSSRPLFGFFLPKVRRFFHQRIQLLPNRTPEASGFSALTMLRFSSSVPTSLGGFLSIISWVSSTNSS